MKWTKKKYHWVAKAAPAIATCDNVTYECLWLASNAGIEDSSFITSCWDVFIKVKPVPVKDTATWNASQWKPQHFFIYNNV